jgi:hypothetical protein
MNASELVNVPIAIAILVVAYNIAIKVIEAFKTYKDNNMSNLCLEIKEMTKTQMQLIDLITKSLVIAEKNNEKNSESLNQVHFQITSILEKIAVIEERVEQCRINKQ